MRISKNCMRGRPIQMVLVLLTMLCFAQCKESVEGEYKAADYDPSLPVAVTDFLPKEGGAGSNLVVYGDNFGNDISRIQVVIGGKVAKVISVKGNALYCIVPAQAYDGDIKVSVLDEAGEDELAVGEAVEVFTYERKWIVTDLVGQYYEVGSMFEEKEGPFGDCGAFKEMNWFTFDPKNPNRMFVAAETNPARIVDLEQRYVSYFRTPGIPKKSVILWKLDGDRDLIVPENHASDTKIAFHIYSRSSNFQSSQPLSQVARGVNGAAIHPVNGEMYYTLFRAGQIRRMDLTTNVDELAFANPFSSVAIYMVIHPSGDYAYITNSERHYILRSDYDYSRKTFKAPYPVAGTASTSGWVDGVGTNARLNRPMQGVFVKNPDYEEAGGDPYDYYFCDRDNHCVRKVTPQGRVSTFAGRGNNGTRGYSNGDLRLEARFSAPRAIAYDETRDCFYVGDTDNWIIRKIALEGE